MIVALPGLFSYLFFPSRKHAYIILNPLHPLLDSLTGVYKKYQRFLSEHFQFLEVKFSIYLNRRVFVTESTESE